MKILLLTLMLGSLAGVGAFAAPASFPGAEWPRTSPEAVGLDPAPLAALDAEYASGDVPLVDSLLVLRCGAVAYERFYPHDYAKIFGKEAHEVGPLNPHMTGAYNYFDPAWHPYFHGTREHSMQSITKSVTATTIGIAIQRGDFKAPLDTPVLHYFDVAHVKNVDDRKRRMTLKHVLTMSTGLDWNEALPYNDPHNPTAPMEASKDWVQFVIDVPMANEPGSTFAYSSGATELLAFIFLKETGQDIEAYARSHLFAPLGIHAYHWKRTPMNVVDTEGGLFLTNEDLARLGYLYLHGGAWNGTQLVAPAFLQQTLTPQIQAVEGFQYGYQWWLYPYDSGKRVVWTGRGFGGQQLLIFPEDDLIAVTTGWDILGEHPDFLPLFDKLRPAVHQHDCAAAPSH